MLDTTTNPQDPIAEEVAELVARSRAAQQQIENYTQEQVNELIRAMVWAVAEESVAEKIAQHTVDETQLGNYDGKYLKISGKHGQPFLTLSTISLSVLSRKITSATS